VTLSLERAVNIAVGACAIAVCIAVVRREFYASPRAGGPSQHHAYVEGGHALRDKAIWFGSRTAPLVLVEFADLECPACRDFQGVVRRLRRDYGDSLAVLHVHLPLVQHRFAKQAAIALECAVADAAGEAFADSVYSKQDSIGLKSWAVFASEAGIADTTAFQSCLVSAIPKLRVEQALAEARSLGVNATPTVFVNGWRFSRTPTLDEIRSAGSRILATGRP
jgi:protein-disulfide isomerase